MVPNQIIVLVKQAKSKNVIFLFIDVWQESMKRLFHLRSVVKEKEIFTPSSERKLISGKTKKFQQVDSMERSSLDIVSFAYVTVSAHHDSYSAFNSMGEIPLFWWSWIGNIWTQKGKMLTVFEPGHSVHYLPSHPSLEGKIPTVCILVTTIKLMLEGPEGGHTSHWPQPDTWLGSQVGLFPPSLVNLICICLFLMQKCWNSLILNEQSAFHLVEGKPQH